MSSITVFTSNQPRHIALINRLVHSFDEVYAVQECTTAFPGQVDDFYHTSEVMQDYFGRVMSAERGMFGSIGPMDAGVRSMPIKMGDLNRLKESYLESVLESDHYLVFGASYIHGWLADFLVEHKAINIHMGMSPWYRGSSTNFWAMRDGRPSLVGATIHLLTHGLDSGPILFHALPEVRDYEPFELGMEAVKVAHEQVVEYLLSGRTIKPVEQDRDLEVRYTRNADFTDEVAADYLANLPTPEQIHVGLTCHDMHSFIYQSEAATCF